MSDFVTSLVDRARGTAPVLRPVPPLYRAADAADEPAVVTDETPAPPAARSEQRSAGRTIRTVPSINNPAPTAAGDEAVPTDAVPEWTVEASESPVPLPLAEAVPAREQSPPAPPPSVGDKPLSHPPAERPTRAETVAATPAPPRRAPKPVRTDAAVDPSNRPSPLPASEPAAGQVVPTVETVEVEAPAAQPLPLDRTVIAAAPVSVRPHTAPPAAAQERRRVEERARDGGHSPVVRPPSSDPSTEAATERHVTVTIGRLEVRVTGDATPAPQRPARPAALSLDEFLRQRGGRG
jgi:hypothetical protein